MLPSMTGKKFSAPPSILTRLSCRPMSNTPSGIYVSATDPSVDVKWMLVIVKKPSLHYEENLPTHRHPSTCSEGLQYLKMAVARSCLPTPNIENQNSHRRLHRPILYSHSK